MAKIPGGYYIKARCIKESEIYHCPPHFREIWDWLMAKANHRDEKVHGKIIKRGQCFVRCKEVLEDLKWKVGYRTERYKRHQYENAMKFLRSREMIAVTKTGWGSIVTILNYDYYQDSKNYERRSESRNESRSLPDTYRTKNKNEKNIKKKEYKYKSEIEFIFKSIESNFDKKYLENQNSIFDCFDKLIRIDQYEPNEIIKIIKYIRNGHWFAPNFMSPLKLRQKNKDKIVYIDYFKSLMEHEAKQFISADNRPITQEEMDNLPI